MLVGLGWAVCPVQTYPQRDGSIKKVPLTDHGFKDATTDRAVIEAWVKLYPNGGWGVSTSASGLTVVDTDQHGGPNGEDMWAKLLDGRPDTTGPRSKTLQDGQHRYFATNGADVGRHKAPFGVGLDILGGEGLVVIPPTKGYSWISTPWDTPLPDVPPWLIAALAKPKAILKDSPVDRKFGVGERNNALTSLLGGLRRAGLLDAGMMEEARRFAAERCDPPMDPHEAELVAKSVLRYPVEPNPMDDLVGLADSMANVLTADDIESMAQWTKDNKSPNATDVGNAERFAGQHESRARYVPNWDRWVIWDGKRWAVDDMLVVRQLSHITARNIWAESARVPDEKWSKTLKKWAYQTENSGRLHSMRQEAEAKLVINDGHLDADPWALNCQNGTLDLRTATLRPHDRSDLITKMVPANYSPTAECPRWLDFLNLVTVGDVDLQLFLQKAVGYTLTGNIDAQHVFIMYGLGANGKSTFMSTIKMLLDEFSVEIDVNTLLSSFVEGTAASPYVAGLQGKRLATAHEIPEGRHLNEDMVKRLTGGDKIVGRMLRGNPVEFWPTHKLWVVGNLKPNIGGTDHAIWRRLLLIPFMRTITEAERRPMTDVLGEFRAELDGILTWAVEGCGLWLGQGAQRTLELPEAVTTATRAYRNEQDLLEQFLAEECQMHPDHTMLKKDLYLRWQEWCKAAGETGASKRKQKWVIERVLRAGVEAGGQNLVELRGIRLWR